MFLRWLLNLQSFPVQLSSEPLFNGLDIGSRIIALDSIGYIPDRRGIPDFTFRQRV